MSGRLILGVLFLLYTVLGWAEEPTTEWACEQTTESKEWKCVNPKKKPATSPDSPEQEPTSESVTTAPASKPERKAKPPTGEDLNAPWAVPSTEPFEPPRTETQQAGWHCKSNAKNNDTWDCNLTGQDPQGQPKLVSDEDYAMAWMIGSSAYDRREESIFQTLVNEFDYNPWASCSGGVAPPPPAEIGSGLGLRESTPMEVISDYSEIFDKEITSFMGNVDMERADQHMMAGNATYDSVAETMDLQGHVLYSESELALFSDTAFLKLGEDKAKLRNVLFINPVAPLRGRAKVAYRDSPTFSYYKDANFTSCPPGNQDWIMHAERLKMNKKSGKASAKHAWLEFKGVPFLYTPYISFPLDNRRLTGFLPPTWGSTGRSGFGVHIPYYWNIAPNHDALFWGRYLSKRGFVFGSLARYLTETSEGSLEFEILPSDNLAGENRGGQFNVNNNLAVNTNGQPVQFVTSKSFRGAAQLKNSSRFTEHFSSEVDVKYVSDPYYFDDLGGSLQISTNSRLHSFANLAYHDQFGDDFDEQTTVSLTTQVENYQNIDINQASLPYQRLPQVLFKAHRDMDSMPLPLALDFQSEYVYFQKKNIDDFFGIELDDYRSPAIIKPNEKDPVIGQRFDIKPAISFPYETASFFITPKIALQHTQYWLQNQVAGKPSQVSRTLPIGSLDTGLFFEREFGDLDSGYIHTLEPRLFYLYIPHTEQSDIPVFDASEYDFTGSQLFRENRFSGKDRIQDANQITYALTSRLLESESGKELLNFEIGQIFYFQDRKVTLLDTDLPETNSLSNLIVGLSGRITDNLRFSSGLQWNPESGDFDRYQAALRYRGPSRELLNLSYRFRRSENKIDPKTGLVATDPFTQRVQFLRKGIDQVDVSFLWPIHEGWSLIGRWQYSFLDESTLESFLGVELDSCCWRFRIVGRRFATNLDNNTVSQDIKLDTGMFIQLELKGLSSFGDKIDDFLEKQISGYRKRNKNDGNE
jgi:LPS-assembly protein